MALRTVAGILVAALATVASADDAALPGVVFVSGPIVDRDDDSASGSYHWRDGYVYPKGATNNAWERTASAPRPGRNLYSLVPARPDGKLTQLTFLKTGEVYDPEPSYDGQRILFSMRKDGEDWYHLFEMNADGSGLRQLTDGPFNDISGVYLPDGRIVFCSDRTGVLDEYHEERSEFLFRMNADGTGIEQLTFNPGIYFEPTVLRNGLIACSFWDAFHISVPPFIKHETYLITLRPDGTEERHLFGAGQYQFYNRTRHSSVGLTRVGELPDGRLLVQSEMGPSIYDPNRGTKLAEALSPIFPATTSVQTGGTTFMTHLSPTGTRSSPYPLTDGRFLMAATLPGSRDIGLHVVDPETRRTELVFDRENVSEWDAVPILAKRPVPRSLPEAPRDPSAKTATYVVVETRAADTPERRDLNQRARFARVIQAEYTDVTTSSHTSLENRILGVVPVLPDGSIAFEAPADTPLIVETLDARGQRLVLQAGYMSARAGEVKSCFGCHADQADAVPNATLLALQKPLTRITRETTDLSYRRNDTDEYRRQALIGQIDTYRQWLQTPGRRRAAIETLAYLPDELTAADRTAIAGYLSDAAPDVRRQAAHTLAVVGSVDEIPALLAVLDDKDWQTQHFAGMALEAITGENLDLLSDPKRKLTEWRDWWQEHGPAPKFIASRLARGEEVFAKPYPVLALDEPRVDTFEWDAWLESVGRTRWVHEPSTKQAVDAAREGWAKRVRPLLQTDPPPVAAVRAAGMLGDAASLEALIPFMVRGQRTPVEEPVPDADDALRRETHGTILAKETVLAIGRIGGPKAIEALWNRLLQHVPDRSPIASRHYQTGPRPEEYTALRALFYAGAKPSLEHVPIIVALQPYTEGEKPRFEDRTKTESQRVVLGRLLLEQGGFRQPIVELAQQILNGKADAQSPLYQAVLAGTNIDRPRSEHGRAFPTIDALAPEQAIHLLANLLEPGETFDETAVAKLLTSPSHRERIDAAVVLRRCGFGPETEAILRAEIAKPYAFREIWSIGKGRSDTQFRDKAYLAMALAAWAKDLTALEEFTDYRKYYRDIRIGLAIGLGFRGTPDAVPLLTKLAGDPIFSVHREAEYAAIAIRDRTPGTALAALPAHRPLKADYAPQGFAFASREPEPLTASGVRIDGNDPRAAIAALQSAVDATKYANVGNTFARNASRMRIADALEPAKILTAEAVLKAPLTPELEAALKAAFDSPYPYAHWLAAQLVARRGDAALAGHIGSKLPQYVQAADTVGFHWAAEALGRLKSEAALPALQAVAVAAPQQNTYGAPGMAYGFSAARAIGMIAPAEDAAMRDLLASENVWLRAGAIDGLVERGDPRIIEQLRDLADDAPSAFLEFEARFGLRRLDAGGG